MTTASNNSPIRTAAVCLEHRAKGSCAQGCSARVGTTPMIIKSFKPQRCTSMHGDAATAQVIKELAPLLAIAVLTSKANHVRGAENKSSTNALHNHAAQIKSSPLQTKVAHIKLVITPTVPKPRIGPERSSTLAPVLSAINAPLHLISCARCAEAYPRVGGCLRIGRHPTSPNTRNAPQACGLMLWP